MNTARSSDIHLSFNIIDPVSLLIYFLFTHPFVCNAILSAASPTGWHAVQKVFIQMKAHFSQRRWRVSIFSEQKVLMARDSG